MVAVPSVAHQAVMGLEAPGWSGEMDAIWFHLPSVGSFTFSCQLTTDKGKAAIKQRAVGSQPAAQEACARCQNDFTVISHQQDACSSNDAPADAHAT